MMTILKTGENFDELLYIYIYLLLYMFNKIL